MPCMWFRWLIIIYVRLLDDDDDDDIDDDEDKNIYRDRDNYDN